MAGFRAEAKLSTSLVRIRSRTERIAMSGEMRRLMEDRIDAAGSHGLVLSGTAVALLAGRQVLAATPDAGNPQDVQFLNVALDAEIEAIATPALGAESKLLQKPVPIWL